MPELSRFYGIIIRMYLEVGEPHHVPHFHAYYGEQVAVFGIRPVESSRANCREDNHAWLQRGRNCTKLSWLRIGIGCKADEGHCPSRR